MRIPEVRRITDRPAKKHIHWRMDFDTMLVSDGASAPCRSTSDFDMLLRQSVRSMKGRGRF